MESLVGYHPDVAWKMEPALEMWIDVDSRPVTLRLAGVLDGQTGRSVFSVVEGLLHEGYVRFAILVDIDPLGPAGFSSLADIQHLVERADGSLSWSRWAEGREQTQTANPESFLELLSG